MIRVDFIREKISLEVSEGTTIQEAQIMAGLEPDAPCGGRGKCGKCFVKMNGNYVKACQTRITQNTQVETLLKERKARILTDGFFRKVDFQPGLREEKIRLEKPEAGEKSSDWERLLRAIGKEDANFDISKIQSNPVLAGTLYEKRIQSNEWYAVYTEEAVLELRREKGRVAFAAFDIGTTTIAGYLLNAENGQTLAVESCMNPQVQYGADVVSRANYALENGIDDLSKRIRTAVREMLAAMAEKAEIEREDIFQVCIVGNTCMHHLFLGISPGSLVHAPYTPAISEGMTLKAEDYDMGIHPQAEMIFLPDIAGYVGADTSGCLMAVNLSRREEISLMLDIGTNGEIVLGNKERLVACSTAAGPAFEGAKIECGMRGASGAVDHVIFQNGEWNYTTVDGAAAVGLCGSGLIDLIAQLCRAGLIDENGVLNSGQGDSRKFMLVPPEKSGNENGVYLTQKDIGEVQLAKAAIAAGIRILLQKMGITEEEVSTVYIAGAFGNYMDPQSAEDIGMLPPSFAEKVVAVGNAAGEGARIALINSMERKEIEKTVKKIEFAELAASPEFQDCFLDGLAFPEMGDVL